MIHHGLNLSPVSSEPSCGVLGILTKRRAIMTTPSLAWSSKRGFFFRLSLFLIVVSQVAFASEVVDLASAPQDQTGHVLADDRTAECFSIDVRIDPVVEVGGDMQVVASLGIGLSDEAADRTESSVFVDLREGNGRAKYVLWHRNENLSSKPPHPKTAGWVDNREYQHPDEMVIRDGVGYHLRLVVWPEDEGSRVRLFIDAMDRPKEEHFLKERITAAVVKIFTLCGGPEGGTKRTSRFSDYTFERISPKEAQQLPSAWETVSDAIDLSYPPMAPVAEAIGQGKMDEAKTLFLEHMRNRSGPPGPTLDKISDTVLHPDWQKISNLALDGQYGTMGYFTRFTDAWTDTNGDTHRWVLQEDPLQLNWARCNGHLNRHFHWVSLAKTWKESGDGRYAKQFSDEVFDWVSREPFFWDRTPTIGGLNLMDGTTFRWGYMNTSNIGRRLELTWWPAYEAFRKAPEFRDDAHVAMLLGMIRQADLISNPSSFAVHDDGAAHTTMALLQTAMLLPEFTASAGWEKLALKRWDEVLARQFHPDGSHVSLSTGYNWATILTLENFIRHFEQFEIEPPARYIDQLERALEHPLLISTPSQTQIPLNDGGWSMVDDHYRRSLRWFPHREDFKWLATKGAEGNSPEKKSLYFENAGQFLMRTGWGEGEQYLFFGAGPWGASHGKQDALNIYTQFGSHLLIRDAGRGSYSGIGNTVHAGRSLSFNTLSPDWAQENSIPHWKQEMHRGFGPPKRRWVSNDQYDYGEGTFEYGWHRPGEHIQGKWVRQVIFVKGEQPARDGYYVVIDTVEPVEEKERTWRHPWQLNLNPPDIGVRDSDKSVVAISSGAALQILPVDPVGDLGIRVIQGQEDPELLGWRVYDKTATPYPTPTYEWTASGTFSRAWVIQAQYNENDWPVASVKALSNENPGELGFEVHRKNGGIDRILRRFPGDEKTVFDSEMVESDLVLLSRNAEGHLVSRLELPDGINSVAKRNPLVIRRD